MSTPSPPPSILLADIGGTWARFALLGSHPRDLREVRRLRCADFPSLEAALAAYLGDPDVEATLHEAGGRPPRREGEDAPGQGAPPTRGGPLSPGRGSPLSPGRGGPLRQVCLALPGPVDQDEISLANNPWTFSRSGLEGSLGLPLTLLNDFVAQAYASDHLEPGELRFTGTPRPDPRGVRVVLGPGTGLGVALRIPGGPVLPSEAGHLGFSPSSDHEVELLRVLRTRFGRVSVERLVSGPGLANLHAANLVLAGGGASAEGSMRPDGSRGTDGAWNSQGSTRVHGMTGADLDPLDPATPAAIATLAAAGDPVARHAVDDFFQVLAAFAGDLALALWAKGGVYISGAVVRKLGAFLEEDRFRARFEAKGRFTPFCRGVALGWMDTKEPGLLGCAGYMLEMERARARSSAAPTPDSVGGAT